MSNILYTAYREHVMLLYETDDQRNDSAVAYINEGLKAGHLCLYASVGAYDTASRWHYDKLSSRIVDFEKNVTEGNLVIIDFRPFFESARKGDRTLFDQTRLHVETLLKKRIGQGKPGKILIFADAACTLSEREEFEECAQLEGWWHDAHEKWSRSANNITVICPHPSTLFNVGTTAKSKGQIAAYHSLTLRAVSYQQQTAEVSRPIRILIAEPEPDLQLVYKRYLDARGLEIAIVSTGKECLELVFNTQASGCFDMILIDDHLKDIPGIQVVRGIKQRLPEQRIVFTSTVEVPRELNEIGVSQDFLQKPFSLSRLLGLVKKKN